MKTIPRIVILAAMISLQIAGHCMACIWDRDTLRLETMRSRDAVHAIIGWFDRNPPKYYEMRLAQVTEKIAKDPSQLDLYDDAGVACDRLGRGEEAIKWMDKKRAAMKSTTANIPGQHEHEYRLQANLGTFIVHHWFRTGADRTNLDPVREARDHIAKAIEINPEAHFGREKYQLKVLEWIIDPPVWIPPAKWNEKNSTTRSSTMATATSQPDAAATKPREIGIYDFIFPDCIGLRDAINTHATRKDIGSSPAEHNLDGWMHNVRDAGQLKLIGYNDAEQGVAGLITLGNAWESVDIYHALMWVTQAKGESSVAYLALQRAIELIDEGKGSLHPAAPPPAKLFEAWSFNPMTKDSNRLNQYYNTARKAADDRHIARTVYMMARLDAGRHPDTDSEFWDQWQEPSPPPLPDLPLSARIRDNLLHPNPLYVGVTGLIALLVGYWLFDLRRRRLAGAKSMSAISP